MLRTFSIIFVCIFIGVGIFSFSEALSQFRTNKSLSWQINNTYKPRLAKLEKDYHKLEKEKSQIVEDLAESRSSISLLEEENAAITETLIKKRDELKSLQSSYKEKKDEFIKVVKQYSDIQKDNMMLRDKITAMFLEIKEMRQTLSSVEELRDKIRELRSGIKKNDDYNQQGEQGVALVGNGGFLIRNGKSTYSPKVTISVTPVEDS